MVNTDKWKHKYHVVNFLFTSFFVDIAKVGVRFGEHRVLLYSQLAEVSRPRKLFR